MTKDTIKFSKRTFMLSVLIILILIGLALYFLIYYPEQQKQSEINLYKKALFDSILCQYECPPENITALNQTQLLPNRNCVVECINQLKEKGYEKNQYSNEELTQDNFAVDIETIIINCRKNNIFNDTQTPDAEKITLCAIEGLRTLRQTYNYLS